ncbi:MAG TPA: hypothetical protein ENH82_12480, partial [bacterium]|nr:hypothetical protein [bacterium]
MNINSIGYIYKTTNNLNGKIYIGKHHKEFFDENYYGSGNWIKMAVKKYGKDNFSIIPLVSCFDEKNLNDMEIHYIKYFRKLVGRNMMYNISDGGDGNVTFGKKNAMYGKVPYNKGVPHSKETREKIRIKALARFQRPDQREWIKNLNKGRKHTEEWKRNMS